MFTNPAPRTAWDPDLTGFWAVKNWIDCISELRWSCGTICSINTSEKLFLNEDPVALATMPWIDENCYKLRIFLLSGPGRNGKSTLRPADLSGFGEKMFTSWFETNRVPEPSFEVSECLSRMVFWSVYAADGPTTPSELWDTVLSIL